MRPYYLRETKRAFDYDVRPILGAKAIGEVTRRDVRELLESIVDRGSSSVANHVLSYLRAALNWAVANDYIETNPCNGLRKPAPSPSRDRALNDNEIRIFWRACDQIGYPFGPLFKLLLLTGQRRGEVAEAKWSEFDLRKALWTLPGERAKNNKPHLVHLAAMAIEIFEALPKYGRDALLFTTTGDTPVSGWSAGLTRLVLAMRDVQSDVLGKHKDLGGLPFTLHDLRRTAATGMAGIGIAPHVVDRILNHTTGKISGVAAIYNRFEYLDERRSALDAWAQHVEGLVRLEKR